MVHSGILKNSLLHVFAFQFFIHFPGGQLTPFAPMCGRPWWDCWFGVESAAAAPKRQQSEQPQVVGASRGSAGRGSLADGRRRRNHQTRKRPVRRGIVATLFYCC